MIDVDGAFARSQSNWNARQIGRLLKFQCYTALGTDSVGEWIYIEYGNAHAWVHKFELRVKDGASLEQLKALNASELRAPKPATLPATGLPTVSTAMKELYKKAVAAGRAGDIVTVIGDCNSEAPVYFGHLAGGVVNLSAYPELERTAAFFAPSFKRSSLATHGSFSSAMAFDDAWSDPAQCQKTEGPLACEMRLSNASIIVIALGTGDTFSWETFEGSYRKIIEHALQNNVVPVLMTKADALESQQGGASPELLNNIVRALGAQYGVPVIDFALAARALPNGGLVDERNLDGKQIAPFHISELAMDARAVMTLHTLAQINPTAAVGPKKTPAPRAPVRPRRPRPTATPKR